MTRTARAAYPRAVNKDRSESRSGLDTSLRKSGAGHHNWGSLADERQLESAALEDELFEQEEVKETSTTDDLSSSSISDASSARTKPAGIARTNSGGLSDEELEKARQFRKQAFKKNEIDLTAIARTSAAVSSPIRSPTVSDATVPSI